MTKREGVAKETLRDRSENIKERKRGVSRWRLRTEGRERDYQEARG